MLMEVVLAPAFVLTCLTYGVLAAMLPAALVMTLIEHHRPARLWRMCAWAGVGLAFVTPSAFALAAILSH